MRPSRFHLASIVAILTLGVVVTAYSAGLTEADKAAAEVLKKDVVAALEEDVEKKELLVRRARAQKSGQLRGFLDDLEEARKKLNAARRKPLEQYITERGSNPPATEKLTPEGIPLGIAGENGFSVVFPYTVAYIPQGAECFEFSFVLAAFDGLKPTEGFFEVDGTPVRLEATSSDATVVEIKPDPEFTLSPFVACFRRPGTATITVQAGRYKAEQPVKVIEIPVNADAPSSDVIQEMGFPTEKRKVYVTWPKDEFIDCFMYSPKAGQPFIGEHWTYEKYPSLVLSIESGKIWKVGTRKRDNPSRAVHCITEPNTDMPDRSAIR
jgi:hypothetical protein